MATSAADDAAFAALADIAAITQEMPDVRIIGGHMVSLLLEAFPTALAADRRTVDADAAIPTAIAKSGAVHNALVARGYKPTSGNHYEAGNRQIDLLVPSENSQFRRQIQGTRGFDSAPGLSLATSASPIELDLTVAMQDGHQLTFLVRVPTVECAVVVKTLATRSRHEAKDYTDLYNLLQLAHEHDREAIGGWRLDEPSSALKGERLDAARQLTLLAKSARRNPVLRPAGVPAQRFITLIGRLVTAAE